MMEIRKLTDKGIEKFQEYIEKSEGASKLETLDLNSKPYSSPADLQADMKVDENKKFEEKREIGKYLTELFNENGLRRSEIIVKKRGLWARIWSWFAYIWLDQLCKKKENDLYKIQSLERYICSTNWNRYYRHLVAMPYYIYSLYGKKYSKMFLKCPTHINKEIMEQLLSRRWIMMSKNLIKAAHRLYWDPEEGELKTGASGKKGPGTARRFGKVINQLRLNYHFQTIKPERVLKLLPSEFDRWK